ncbi:MAG: transposase family protein [Syntrophobacteraceae bacterium]
MSKEATKTQPKPRKLSELSETQMRIAEAREAFLDLAKDHVDMNERELGRLRALKRFLSSFNRGLIGSEIREKLRKKTVSKTTYFRWLSKHEGKGNSEVKGLAALADAYSASGTKIPQDIQCEIEKLVWENHLCRYQDVFDDLEVVFRKGNIPSYPTIRRFVLAYKAEHWPELVLKHEGRTGLRDRNMLPAIGHAAANITRPNQLWEMDTTLADLFNKSGGTDTVLVTSDGKRLKLIGVCDVYSRMLAAFFVERETALAVGQVLRHLIIHWGKPEEISRDNGRPFKNARINTFLRSLGVAVHTCLPGNPVEKPFVERGFRTITEGLFRRLCGYSGNSVADRPSEIEIKYTQSEAQRLLNEYIQNVYAEDIHGTTKQRPRERMAQPGFKPETVDPSDLDVLLMKEYRGKVGQCIIRHQGGRFFHKTLPEGQWVTFRANDFDASEIIVFQKNEYLCTAEDFSRKGRTPEEILEAKKEAGRELRTRMRAHEAILDKSRPKDFRIKARIEQATQDKPVELPRKADVISFPDLKDIAFSSPSADPTEQPPPECFFEAGQEQPTNKILTRQDFYLDIRRREAAGKPLDDMDRAFLDEFLDSPEYRLVGPTLDEKVKTGANP